MEFWESLVGVLLTAKGIALAVVGFGMMVVAHEFGHFLACKLVGARVERFSVGFGWKLFSRTWGETEYMICAVPLGGYVKPAGGDEGQEATGAPDELISKTPGQRAVVFLAGPVFSILFGIPLAIVMFLIGREVHVPQISSVMVDSGAWHAGVKRNDRITSIAGQDLETGNDLRAAVIASPYDEKFPLEVDRDGRILTLTAVRKKQEFLGVSYPISLPTLKIVKEGKAGEEAGLKVGDEVVSVNGRKLRAWRDFRVAELSHPEKPLAIVVRRGVGGQSVDGGGSTQGQRAPPRETVQLTIEAAPEGVEVNDPGFTVHVPNEVGYVREGFPAEGKLEPGDRILEANGKLVERWWEIEDAAWEDRSRLTLVVQRDGKRLSQPVTLELEKGTWLADTAGIAPTSTFVVASVAADAAMEPRLEVGDRIVKGKGVDVGDAIRKMGCLYWPEAEILTWLADLGTLKVQRGDGEPLEVRLGSDLKKMKIGRLYVAPTPMMTFRQESLAGSLAPAVRETLQSGLFVYVVLRRLVEGDQKGSNVAGPLGIFQIIYVTARRGWASFFWLIHMLTVNIGLLNLLPLPPLDGGRLLMLGYEKARGRRMSQRLQEVVLIAGIAVILAVFLFATFNDVRRIFFNIL